MPHHPARREACVGSQRHTAEEDQCPVTEIPRAGDDPGIACHETGADEDGSLEDDLARWQQRVLERPREGLRSLEIMFASSGYDALVVLCLPHNAIDDITPIGCAAKTLRLLNLNANAIARLPSPNDGFWSRFEALTLLFLSGNSISSWSALEGIVQCQRLLWLTVDGNPLMSRVNAREFIVNMMPLSLKALNDHVITDIEYIRHAGRSIRFGAQNVRLFIGDALSIPLEFDEDESLAMRYIRSTETTVHQTYSANSPTLIAQRVVRGHLSRQHQLPLFARIRRLVVKVQSAVRGYLFRRAIRCEFVELVTQLGQQDLLFGPMDDALFMTGGAHRGLKKLVGLIRQWRVRFRLKKQAIAIKKIRFWCQMVYQRYRYRSQQLLQDQQEIFIYYTAPFEEELLEMALKTVHRDPVLMSLTPPERERLIRQRCVPSGVSVLRIPTQARVVIVSPPSSPQTPALQPPPSTPQRIQRENAQLLALKKTLTPPLVRIFPKDLSLETQVLVTEKRLLQQDLAMMKEMKRQVPPTSDKRVAPLQRAVAVHSTQLRLELERRLVIVNRRILTACIAQQQQKTRPRAVYSLANVRIRVRGHVPTRPERRKIIRLLPSTKSIRAQGARAAMIHSHFLTEYTKMRVFIPWSIDMYMQITASLDRVLVLANVSASFALTFEQTRQIHAAAVIQSAWRASRQRCKRDELEVTIVRAILCLQRWWRHCMGLCRRMAFVRACLLVCGAINTTTLFMEASVYHLLSDPARWSVVRTAMRPCREQALHCLLVDSNVEISLSPAQMLLYASSTSPSSASHDRVQLFSKVEASCAQRCGAYLPAWMAPGVPEHFEESMVSRDSDATPHLLVDHVHVEPTVIERELLLLGGSGGGSASLGAENPFRRFAACRQVIRVGSKVLELARKFSVEHRKTVPPSMDTATVTSFVRLTFDSVEQARHRAVVLLAKTFDPITHSYARLFSTEALVGATMLRHQWAAVQALGDANDSEAFLSDCKVWLQAELPSRWLVTMRDRLPPELVSCVPADESRLPSYSHPQVTRQSVVSKVPRRPAPPLASADLALSVAVDGPAPIHLAEAVVETGVQPSMPTPQLRSARPFPSGSMNRHQVLTDRLGKSTCHTLDDARSSQQAQRDYAVRDLREERERAVEARIVDKRMLQRENAAELAGIHLEMHVKLQKIKYEQELAKLQTRELVEREKMSEHKRKLTRRFETSFVAQTGAMMRSAARRAVEATLVKKEVNRQVKAVEIRERGQEALVRRQDAKSYCFVSNQRAKESVADRVEIVLADREAKEEKREKLVRKRIQEDKEIKTMLRLM